MKPEEIRQSALERLADIETRLEGRDDPEAKRLRRTVKAQQAQLQGAVPPTRQRPLRVRKRRGETHWEAAIRTVGEYAVKQVIKQQKADERRGD